MATSEATARIHADALRSLKDTGPQIAVQLGIEPPKLNFSFKDKDYQQAQELTALAAWLTTVNTALGQDLAPATKGGKNVKHSKTKNP